MIHLITAFSDKGFVKASGENKGKWRKWCGDELVMCPGQVFDYCSDCKCVDRNMRRNKDC